MEHYPQAEPMTGPRRRFNFEAFDALIAEALDDLPAPTPATGSDLDPLPELPQAEVIDLNANVVDLYPPDGAA